MKAIYDRKAERDAADSGNSVPPMAQRRCAAHNCPCLGTIDATPYGGGVCAFHYGEKALAWPAITAVLREHERLLMAAYASMSGSLHPNAGAATVGLPDLRPAYGETARNWADRALGFIRREAVRAAAAAKARVEPPKAADGWWQL